MSENILRNVELVHVVFRIWSGSAKMLRSDFDKINVADLPDDDVMSLGVKKLCDPDDLAGFGRVRYLALKVLSEAGFQFLGAWAIPQDAVAQVSVKLKALCDEFDALRDEFLINYDTLVEDWIRQKPDFENQIRSSKIPAEELKSRFRASFSVYRVIASERDKTGSMSDTSSTMRTSVLAGVASDCRDYIEKLASFPDSYFRATVRTNIRSIADKINRFSFCDPSGQLSTYASALLDATVGDGKIDGDQYRRLRILLLPLNDDADIGKLLTSLSAVGSTVLLPKASPAPGASTTVSAVSGGSSAGLPAPKTLFDAPPAAALPAPVQERVVPADIDLIPSEVALEDVDDDDDSLFGDFSAFSDDEDEPAPDQNHIEMPSDTIDVSASAVTPDFVADEETFDNHQAVATSLPPAFELDDTSDLDASSVQTDDVQEAVVSDLDASSVQTGDFQESVVSELDPLSVQIDEDEDLDASHSSSITPLSSPVRSISLGTLDW